MLTKAHAQGAQDALASLGIKEAAGFLRGIAQNLVGQPGRAFIEGPRALKPGGFMSAKNVFWPAVSGPGGSKLNWINRASTVMGGLGVARALKGDGSDNESGLSRALGAAGGLAGMAYGYPALGALGAPVLGAVGSRIGHGIGQALS